MNKLEQRRRFKQALKFMLDDKDINDFMISSNTSMLEQIIKTAVEIHGEEAVLFALRWANETEKVMDGVEMSDKDQEYMAINNLVTASMSSGFYEDSNTPIKAYFILLCIWDKAAILPDSLEELNKIVGEYIRPEINFVPTPLN